MPRLHTSRIGPISQDALQLLSEALTLAINYKAIVYGANNFWRRISSKLKSAVSPVFTHGQCRDVAVPVKRVLETHRQARWYFPFPRPVFHLLPLPVCSSGWMEVAPRRCRFNTRWVTESFKIQIERSLSFYHFGIPHHSTAAPGVALELGVASVSSADLQWPDWVHQPWQAHRRSYVAVASFCAWDRKMSAETPQSTSNDELLFIFKSPPAEAAHAPSGTSTSSSVNIIYVEGWLVYEYTSHPRVHDGNHLRQIICMFAGVAVFHFGTSGAWVRLAGPAVSMVHWLSPTSVTRKGRRLNWRAGANNHVQGFAARPHLVTFGISYSKEPVGGGGGKHSG